MIINLKDRTQFKYATQVRVWTAHHSFIYQDCLMKDDESVLLIINRDGTTVAIAHEFLEAAEWQLELEREIVFDDNGQSWHFSTESPETNPLSSPESDASEQPNTTAPIKLHKDLEICALCSKHILEHETAVYDSAGTPMHSNCGADAGTQKPNPVGVN